MVRALDEVASWVDAFFEGRSQVHLALRRVTRALDEVGVPYAIAGGMAANAHGYRRTTEDVGLLLTPEGLAAFKARWLGRGWVERFAGSKGLKDAETGVKIDVLLAGDFPGDGKPKPVAFPEPGAVVERAADGTPYLRLATLVELELASGMTAPHRPQDLADVIQLVRANRLPRAWGERLHPYVQAKWDELWALAQVDEDA